jgi:hypothetical protein
MRRSSAITNNVPNILNPFRSLALIANAQRTRSKLRYGSPLTSLEIPLEIPPRASGHGLFSPSVPAVDLPDHTDLRAEPPLASNVAAPGHERLTAPAAERRVRPDRINQEDVLSPAALLER